MSLSCSKIPDISMSCDIDDNFTRQRTPMNSQNSIQDDIKGLLHKAMRLRNTSTNELSIPVDRSISAPFERSE